jgi:hypothetical protein
MRMLTRPSLLSLLFIIIFIGLTKTSFSIQYPTFEDFVGALSTGGQRTNSRMFNQFMRKNKGKIVYLFIFFDEKQQIDFDRDLSNPDEYNRIIFSVKDDYINDFSTGAEYLIHLPKDTKIYYFEYIKSVGRLSGYFKIWNISGPRQGFFSINLRPVKAPA